MALPKIYDMSMASQASMIASNTKLICLTTVRLILIFHDILKHVASTMKRLLNPLLQHGKEDDKQRDGWRRALQ